MFKRIYLHWVYGGSLAALLILGLLPLFAKALPWPLVAIFLQLPIYMLHQYEEHDGGRFERFVNGHVGGGRTILTPEAIFLINVPGVWGINLLSIWLAVKLDIGFGLIGIYLTVTNSVIHIIPTFRMRIYNPGLLTGIILLLPTGIWGLYEISTVHSVSLWYHALGLGSALLIHIAILCYVFAKRWRSPSCN